ncbi:hypothetical protein Dimus_009213 [Dionaea muscipula]
MTKWMEEEEDHELELQSGHEFDHREEMSRNPLVLASKSWRWIERLDQSDCSRSMTKEFEEPMAGDKQKRDAWVRVCALIFKHFFNNAGFVGDSLNRNMFVSLICTLKRASNDVKKWRPAKVTSGFTFLVY